MGEWIVHLIQEMGYGGVALLMFIETLFPPVPSEIIMSLAGLQAARGVLGLPGVIVAGTFGAMLGNILWFLVARALGYARFRPLVDRFGRLLTLDWAEVRRADHFFDRYERWFVCLGRMVPTIRSLVSIPAGLFGMKLVPFIFWSTIGTLGWTALLAIAGFALGARFAMVEEYMAPASTLVIAGIGLWYVYRVVTWRPRA